jgi:diacylglycerol O-acyltransferase
MIGFHACPESGEWQGEDHMRRLSPLDALFLYLETPRAYMHTLKIAILDPSGEPGGFSFDAFSERFRERLHRAPPLRWRFASTPLGLHHPIWIEDSDFNIDYHLRRVACPAPGDERTLCELISRLCAWPLDRSRPLWVGWIVEGLQGGRVAAVFLVHHAYFDGNGAGYLLQQICNAEPGGDVPPPQSPWVPEPWPSARKRLWWALRDLPETLGIVWPKAFRGVRKLKRLHETYQREALPPTPEQAPETPLSQPLSPGRTYACRSFALDDFKRIGAPFGFTVNDVFVACCAGAVRRLLADLSYDPDRGPLVASIPLSRRRPENMDGIGNFSAADYLWLRIDVADPVERLRRSHEAASVMKAHFKASEGGDLVSILGVLPPAGTRLLNRIIRSKQGRIGLLGNLVLSNVPGPPQPLYFGSTRIENWFSTGQIADGTTLNMTVWSYAGNMNLNVVADSKMIPDGWMLIDYFQDCLVELLDKVGREPSPASGYQGRELPASPQIGREGLKAL